MNLVDFDALSFDCYGTLIDWEAGIAAVLRRWAGARGLAIHETKWRTRGVLESAGASAVQGWAIHEVVRFRT